LFVNKQKPKSTANRLPIEDVLAIEPARLFSVNRNLAEQHAVDMVNSLFFSSLPSFLSPLLSSLLSPLFYPLSSLLSPLSSSLPSPLFSPLSPLFSSLPSLLSFRLFSPLSPLLSSLLSPLFSSLPSPLSPLLSPLLSTTLLILRPTRQLLILLPKKGHDKFSPYTDKVT
jgi:hypothetical protein